MSNFEDLEISQDSGKPFELYLFIYGPNPTDYYAYTNAVREIPMAIPTIGNVTFTPIPIGREKYASNGKVDQQNMNIRVPVTADLSALFLDFPPTQPVGVIIYQGHFGMTDEAYPAVWNGRVLSSSRERNEQVLTCSSAITSMKRVGMRRNYQYGCPFVLYGNQCKANRAAATYPAVVAEVGRNTMSFIAGWNGTMPLEKFLGGMIHWTSDLGEEYRQITKQEGPLLYFAGPVRGVEVGDNINVILGCNHKTDDCKNLHNNILNYGGQPWIPLKNPIKYQDFW